MIIALIAFFSMMCQDVLGTLMVQSQARNHGWIAGFCDAGMWLAALFSYGEAITHTGHEKWLIIGFVTVANVFGNRLGVAIGRREIKQI